MNRSAVILTGFLCLEGHVLAAAQSDWIPASFDPIAIARRSQLAFKTFDHAWLKGDLFLKCPFPADPTTPWGTGNATCFSYFWSPSKFQAQYTVFSTKPATRGAPVSEWVISDGSGHIERFGPEVGTNLRFDPKSSLFNVASDAQLVEAWPSRFPKFLLSPLVGGNATMTRYVTAIMHGVGGYRIEKYARTIRVDMQRVDQYRLVATRGKSGKRPQSTVSLIFNVAAPYLPVTINTTYGDYTQLDWSGSWVNGQPSAMPETPHTIGPAGKKRPKSSVAPKRSGHR